MTPDRLRECLGALNWSTAALAAMAQVSPVTARRRQAGKRPISEQVGAADQSGGARRGTAVRQAL
jgi:hypothetical protein